MFLFGSMISFYGNGVYGYAQYNFRPIVQTHNILDDCFHS